MTDFIIKNSPIISPPTLAGQYTKRLRINALVDRKFPVAVDDVPNSDILKSYLGLLVQGKNDFDAIERFQRRRTLETGRPVVMSQFIKISTSAWAGYHRKISNIRNVIQRQIDSSKS